MGINKQTLKFMFNENKYKPFEGFFLALGKQTITIEKNELNKILHEYGFGQNLNLDKDTETRAGKKFEAVDDVSLFRIFNNLDYKSSDHSDYENAHFILDLNYECPKKYENKFDIIYSGGTLDNIFNPAQGIINIYKMLKPGGRALITEASAYHAGVYTAMSPEWLASFFAVNECVDVQVYCYCVRSSKNQWVFDTDLFKWDPHFTRRNDFDYVKSSNAVGGQMYTMLVAEKSLRPSNKIVMPIQSHYMEPKDNNWVKTFDGYNESKRIPPSTGSKKENVVIPLLTDHFSYIGSEY